MAGLSAGTVALASLVRRAGITITNNIAIWTRVVSEITFTGMGRVDQVLQVPQEEPWELHLAQATSTAAPCRP